MLMVFDARPFLRPGEHALRLWLRAPHGRTLVSSLRYELMGFPSRIHDPDIVPMVRVLANDIVNAYSPGSVEQPRIPSGCGPYTKLLDFYMPAVDGFGAAAALKADPRTRDVPIIFRHREFGRLAIEGDSPFRIDLVVRMYLDGNPAWLHARFARCRDGASADAEERR